MTTNAVPIPAYSDSKSVVSSIAMKNAAFERLPDEIIEQILLLTNPNAFASLIILNRKWRTVSQQAHLYAHHLSRCPSYSAAHHTIPIPEDRNSLPRLRRLFAQEIKRNLFEAYLRPRESIISLVSTSISSSSAPGGEAFHFSLSHRGHYVLAYSSSRIHVLDVTGDEVTVKRELKILRRPASTTITDDGSLLAVLSTDLQIDLYDLTGDHPKHIRSIALDHIPRTIALSPTGSVLAAAYDSGVEVSSLDPNYTNTDRRSVKCYAVDSLSFSRDGTQLLGTTMQSRSPSTVILTAPYYEPEASSPEETVSALWTTSILFPNGSRDCSHAVLLPSPSDGEASWTFTYDRILETFRAVRIDDLRNGTTYFTGPIADSVSKLLPSTLPAASQAGDLVASGFQGSIWLYGVPEDLDALPIINGSNSNTESEVSTPSSQLGRRNSAPSLTHRGRDSILRTPQWQLLCDRLRNTFIEGRRISSLDRVSAMCWVSDRLTSAHGERLVAVAPGVLDQSKITEDDGMSPVDGGRISILDFDYSVNDGQKRVITIEVGMNEPEVLEEELRDLDTEVAIVRKRTVAQRRGHRNHVSRSATTAPRPARHDPPPMPNIQDIGDPYASSARPSRRPSQMTTSTEQSETSIDEQEAFDAPYSHTSPRSGTTLRRAATAAAVNRRLHPQAVAQEHIEYRRADGREEHPHESDADNWVPPPPPYSRDPIPPLPEHIQRSLLAESAVISLQRSRTQRSSSIDFPNFELGTLSRSRTVASTSTGSSRREERFPYHRTFSDSTTRTTTTDRLSFEDEDARPVTRPVSMNDDLYDVSPPGTPQPRPRQTSLGAQEPVQTSEIPPVPSPTRPVPNQIPRRAVGAPANNTNGPPLTPKPAMLATLQKPVSPIRQPSQPVAENLDRRLQDWENTLTEPLPALNTATISSSPAGGPALEGPFPNNQSQTRNSNPLNIDKEVPPRPNENHHLTELPPTTPIVVSQRERIESELSAQPRRSETAPIVTSPPRDMVGESLSIWRRAGTAPAIPTQLINEPGVAMPSSDQMARLNSRKGRPAGAADPRRLSGSSNQNPRFSSGGFNNAISYGPTQYNTSQRLTPQQAFDATQGRNQTSSNLQRPTTGYPQPSNSSYPQSQSRRISSAPNPSNSNYHRQPSNPLPSNLRPPLSRLETIHSITSLPSITPEPSPYFAQKQIMSSLHRTPSRAERGAAKNIKDAKKRGWRNSLKKEEKENKRMKDKYGDGASSAGWTDVTMESGIGGRSASRLERREKEGKGTRCVVM